MKRWGMGLFKFLGMIASILCTSTCYGQFSLTTPNVAVLETFDSFEGNGFQPGGGAGTLDSNSFSLFGLSDGNLPFGGTATTGDFARGISTGGVTTGGIYAFDIGGGDIALGLQAVNEEDFTAGEVTILVSNDTGVDLSGITVALDGFDFNDQDFLSVFDFSFSVGGIDFTDIFAFSTGGIATNVPSFESTGFSASIGVPILAGEDFFLRISGDTQLGTGLRDEVAIDNLSFTGLTVVPEPASASFLGLCGLAVFSRRRR